MGHFRKSTAKELRLGKEEGGGVVVVGSGVADDLRQSAPVRAWNSLQAYWLLLKTRGPSCRVTIKMRTHLQMLTSVTALPMVAE